MYIGQSNTIRDLGACRSGIKDTLLAFAACDGEQHNGDACEQVASHSAPFVSGIIGT
jgi:hypothetical protein